MAGWSGVGVVGGVAVAGMRVGGGAVEVETEAGVAHAVSVATNNTVKAK